MHYCSSPENACAIFQFNRFMCKFSVFEMNMKNAIVVDLTDQHTKFFSFCSFTKIRVCCIFFLQFFKCFCLLYEVFGKSEETLYIYTCKKRK